MKFVKSGRVKLVALVAMLIISGVARAAFTYDEVYPDLREIYYPITYDSTLRLVHNTPHTQQGGGRMLNVSWGSMTRGQSVRLRVLLPPGAGSAAFALQTNDFVAAVGVCDDGVANCRTTLTAQSPVVWPLNYVPGQSSPTQLISDPNGKYVEIVIEDPDSPFYVFTLELRINIVDQVKYETWRTTVLPTLTISPLTSTGGNNPAGATDTQPPTTPTNLTAPPTSSSQINLSWTASTDNVGVTNYRITRNGTVIETNSSATTYTDTGLSPSTSYTYTVAACDARWNCSSPSTPVSAQTPATGTTPPPGNGTGSPVTLSLSIAQGQRFEINNMRGRPDNCAPNYANVLSTTLSTTSNQVTGNVLSTAAPGTVVILTCTYTDSSLDPSMYRITVVAPLSITALSAASALTHNSATFSATADSAATGYWVVRPKGADGAPPVTPTAAQIVAAPSGSAELTANASAAINLSALSADTDYWLFFFARATGGSGYDTPVQVRQFHTQPTPVSPESLTATATGHYDAFGMSANLVPQNRFVNQTGNYFIQATLLDGSVYSLVSSGTSYQWNLGTLNYFGVDQALAAQQPITIFRNFNLVPLFDQIAGAVIRAGYRITADNGEHASNVYTLASSRPNLSAEQVTGENKLRVTFEGFAAKAYWQRINAGSTCQDSAAIKTSGASLIRPASASSAELPLTGLAPDTAYTVCFAVEDATGILGSSTATAVRFTSIPASVTLSDAEAITATAATFRVTPEVVGTGKWLVKPAGETAPTDAEFAASTRTHALTAQESSFTVNRLTPGTAYKAYFRLDYTSAGAARTSRVLEKTFATPALTLTASPPDASHVQGTSATLAAQSNGDGLLYWRVRPAGETAVPAAATIKAQGRVVPQIVGLPARIVVSGLTAGTAQNVDFLMSAGGAEEVKTVNFTTTASATVADEQFVWETSTETSPNLQAIIAPANFPAGATGQYYVYVVLPGADNTLQFAKNNAGSDGGYAQTFQQDNQLQPYFTDSTMIARKVLTLAPASAATAPAFSGVEVYAGYRIGTTATDPVYWGYLHTFSAPATAPTTAP